MVLIMIRELLTSGRNKLEGLDYRLQRLPVTDTNRAYDCMRRSEGLSAFRRAWWKQSQLESYGALRRYAKLLDHASLCPPRLPHRGITRHPASAGGPRILMLRMGHLGDIIHLMPTAREIRRQRPDWKLELITGPWNRELVELYDLFDEIHYWTPDVVQFNRGKRDAVQSPTNERTWIESLSGDGVDVLFCPSVPHFCELPIIIGTKPDVYVGGEWKIGADYFPAHTIRTLPFNSRHYEMDAIADFLPLLGLERPAVRLYWPGRSEVGGRRSEVGINGDRDCSRVQEPRTKHKEQKTKPMVLIFPGSGWPGKNWLPERFAALGDELTRRGMSVGIAGAPGEKALCENIAARMNHPVEVWAGRLDLRGVADRIAEAVLVVGNDSAPIHIAAALHVPTLSLWGPTLPEKWAPRGEQHRAVKSELCAGCIYWHTSARCQGRPPCMALLPISQVLKSLHEVNVEADCA